MAKSVTVTVGCKLPHGIILSLPLDPNKTVKLNGANTARIIGAGFGTTDVDADFWDQWSTIHGEFPAVKSGAIFVAKNANDAQAVANELVAQKTGFEAMKKTAGGVKPADNKD